MTIYEIDKDTLDFLQHRASRIGEDLGQLWFDPFFWHPSEMQQLKFELSKSTKEYRGLLNDDISFMEIRRKGKRRKKYTVAELIGTDQLFPMVGLSTSNWNSVFNRTFLLEHVTVTGCPAQFIFRGQEALNLFDWKFIRCSGPFGKAFLTCTEDSLLKLTKDDYLVRGQYLIIQGLHND
ncbi:MAG: hypothetical protein H6602_01310 [Flavobacteriales bacterium]|nr:hypothetical protein [Flavobacteriales bacterium]